MKIHSVVTQSHPKNQSKTNFCSLNYDQRLAEEYPEIAKKLDVANKNEALTKGKEFLLWTTASSVNVDLMDFFGFHRKNGIPVSGDTINFENIKAAIIELVNMYK